MSWIDQQAVIDPGTTLAINVAAYTASTNGNAIDTAGYSGVTFIGFTAATTTADADNGFTFKLQHSDASSSDFEDVPIGDVQGSMVINAAADDDIIIGKMSYVPQTVASRRYVKLVATELGTASATFGALAIKTGGRKTPIA